MKTLIQSNDPVLLSFVGSLLKDAGIEYHIFDSNISNIDGCIGVFPKRISVRDNDYDRARLRLDEADLGSELIPE